MNILAVRKVGNIPGWEPYQWERIGNTGLRIKGAVLKTITRGSNKGKKTTRGSTDTIEVCVSFDEIEAEDKAEATKQVKK